jgi:hypothetical protein
MRDLIVNKLKLQWEPEVLEFHKNPRSVLTHSQSRKYCQARPLQLLSHRDYFAMKRKVSLRFVYFLVLLLFFLYFMLILNCVKLQK